MITVTEAAADHVKRFLAGRDGVDILRIGIRTAGCSGFAYVVDVAEEVSPDDTLFEDHGVKIVVDSDSLAYLDGTEIDYARQGLNAGFKFNNPNVRNTCGCGESFGV
jgi:iron-sulfur cluster assembly protein